MEGETESGVAAAECAVDSEMAAATATPRKTGIYEATMIYAASRIVRGTKAEVAGKEATAGNLGETRGTEAVGEMGTHVVMSPSENQKAALRQRRKLTLEQALWIPIGRQE